MKSVREQSAMIRAALEDVVIREGFELVDVEMVTEHRREILRLYIDTMPPGDEGHGVTVDDCSKVSRIVGDILDVEDIVKGEYALEVSSPGLFRPLTKPEHFERAIGTRIRVKTFEKVDGRKVFVGTLRERGPACVVVEVDGTGFQVPLDKIAKANLEPTI